MVDTKKDALTETELELEQQVVAFLTRNPDFLQRHQQLLALLDIAHDQDGDTVSLIERQVQVLRSQQRSHNQQLQDLVTTARDNERLADRLHRVTLEAAGFDQLDHALESLPPLIRESLDVQQVVIRIASDEPAGARPEIVPPGDAEFSDLRARVSHGRSVSDDRLPPALLRYLFGQAGNQVAACMLIPLGGRHPIGVLAVGSDTAGRFSATQGTLYLERLGQVLGAGLRRLLV
jgi:uncharacterized protein YigA (DUF484 family)